MGSGMMSSPRRALEICPPRSRARMKWSSASREGALKAQQEPVVEVPRVIQAVFVADQGAGHAA